MLTLENYLTQTPPVTSFGAGLQRLCMCSLFAKRLLNKNATLLADLLEHHQKVYTLTDMQAFLGAAKLTLETEDGVCQKALRQLRQRVMLRVMYRDLNGLADLQEVVATVSQLAEFTVNTAIDFHQTKLIAQYGAPCNEAGKSQSLIVIGMGKLGGMELNVSSDIDLIFSYEEDGETNIDDPKKRISNQDFFIKLGKKLISAIDENTEDGFVFRVDMRLRPFGSEGALVSSLDALEDYYQNNGREWERYAWIKGRVITHNGEVLERLLKPFVFRKYLDFGAFASMRDLKIQIQRDVNIKGMQDNIKLGRGGIREIEFIAQVFQLIRGGQDASLQIKPTLQVLAVLGEKGMCLPETVKSLRDAYTFLRNLEHRLMYVEDAQTQELPTSVEARARIANAMNFHDWEDFLTALNQHRKLVQQYFDETFSDAQSSTTVETETQLWDGGLSLAESETTLQNLGFEAPAETLRRIHVLHQSSRYLQLPAKSRQRFDALMPLVISSCAKMPKPEIALIRVIDLLESICRRASYLALLAEHPHAMDLLVKLCSSSPWLTQYLVQHPILLDELLDTRQLYEAPDFVALRMELNTKLAQFAGDIEQQMDAMRHFKHACIFRFAAQDIAGQLSLETLSDYLSDLADLVLNVSLETIWTYVKKAHIVVPKFAVIGYGKLGGKELGYGSDLDIIFLYDDEAPEANEVYGRFAQRINNWFNSLTSAGLLYETDLQLRPDGNSGLLVSSIAAFRDYQINKAWVWEHQAITRARFVAGDKQIGQAFEDVKLAVMTQSRNPLTLKTEVLNMREKMHSANKAKLSDSATAMFDLKNSRGGIIDVEFLVQYLVLAHAAQYPQLADNIGNIALLKCLADLNVISQDTALQVAEAYRIYRSLQHASSLQGTTSARVELESVEVHAKAVTALWGKVFS
jgi:[glutamine synthetase] adenylyltransferase / [glutamine synthetase]-adenylyl-L-tyrosine phosphorylase